MTTDPVRLWSALGVMGLWLLLLAWTVWRARRKAAPVGPLGNDVVLIAHASQTGFGEALAEMTAQALRDGGVAVRLIAFTHLDAETLKAARRALLIVATTGEGDAPDSAAGFVRRVMKDAPDLSHLSYGLLALGDREYAQFCGFGRGVDHWLRAAGAAPLFDPVEVDNGDAGAVRHWQHSVSQALGAAAGPDWTPPAYETWRLAERTLANPGSPGGEAWRLTLEPAGALPVWAAGDIAEIGPPGDPAPAAREYSVASVPADGRVELLVRLMKHPDGTTGLASGWLAHDLALGGEVPMRLRANRAFHGPAAATPMILIGNGTGLAGLRAHLKARAVNPVQGGAWLLFGERTAAHDSFYDAELQAWRASGVLTRLDRCFSRDAGDGRYVQTLVAEAADDIRAWVDRGAAIYVCGSLEGMSQAAHAALEAALGADRLADLLETGRYRRDVY